MNRKDITKFLGELLVRNRLTGRGKYYASEVSLDYGTTNVKRVDFMQFEPAGVVSVGEIEKGIFTSYEVKSCKSDFNSGFEDPTQLDSNDVAAWDMKIVKSAHPAVRKRSMVELLFCMLRSGH